MEHRIADVRKLVSQARITLEAIFEELSKDNEGDEWKTTSPDAP